MLRLGGHAVRIYRYEVTRRPPWTIAYALYQCQRAFASRRKSDQAEEQHNPVIKWFNQLMPGSSRSQPIDPEEGDGEEDSPEARAVRSRIEQLEAEIADLSGKNKPTLIEPLLATLSPEDEAKVRKALVEEEEEEDDLYENDISLMDLPKLEKLGPKLELGREQVVYLRGLDKCLRNAADDVSDASTRYLLWKTYRMCKHKLPPFLKLAPDSVFRVLWESQMSAEGPHRASHICELGRDMVESGKQLSQQQVLFYIESLIRQNRLDEAHENWLKESSRLDNNDSTRLEYRYLGIRIFAGMNQPEVAQELGMSLVSIGSDMLSSIFTPIIVAWIKRGDEMSLKNAWTLYLRLRTELGARMAINDFDIISLTLLNCGRTDMALAVFKDLMLSETGTSETSDELYKAACGIVGKLQSNSIDTAQLSKVSLTVLIAMPRRFQNKYFYGSWMKHLIGRGEVNAAAAVTELMMERAVKPDARHMNGIIAAWLRNGNVEERAKAEQMGWAMIAQRLDFVRKRRSRPLDPDVQDERIQISRWPKYMQRTMPLATTETFSILLLDFERRSREKQIALLQNYFIEAELTPNSYYINHLMYAELRQGRHLHAWQIFQSMPAHVVPDLSIFACLWDCEKRNLGRPLPQDQFPGPRKLLGSMISWYSALSEKARQAVREECSRSFYDQVIRCMCLSKDLEGTIVALYVMKEMFGLFPDKDTARMLTMQVARVATDSTRKPSRARQTTSALMNTKGNMVKMNQLLDLVKKERAKILIQRGVNIEAFNDLEIKEELLIVLATYLQVIMRRSGPKQLDFEERINSVAQEMGAPDMSEVVKHLTG